MWQDIRYQRRYRQRRKAELVKLQQTLTALNSKAAFYQEQINYYDTYIKTCLDNLNRKWVEIHGKFSGHFSYFAQACSYLCGPICTTQKSLRNQSSIKQFIVLIDKSLQFD